MLWESCSHSRSVLNIASLAVAMETCDPWILAKLAIFATDMLWESCSKFHYKHFCHNMFYQNIVSLDVIIIIKFYMYINKKTVSTIFLLYVFLKAYMFLMTHDRVLKKGYFDFLFFFFGGGGI